MLRAGLILYILLCLISCKKENTLDQNKNFIEYFSIESISISIKIDEDQQNIEFIVPANVDIRNITPKISISQGATIHPASYQIIDLSDSVEYTVTAANGPSRSYLVSATQVNDTALLIIDLQKGSFNRPEPMYNVGSICENILSVAAKTREANNRLVYIIQADAIFFIEGSSDWEILPILTPEEGDIIVSKDERNAFQDTRLRDELNNINVGCVIICGVATDFCVNSTFLGAHKRGYKIIVIEDGHSTYESYALETIETHNERWAAFGADVLPAVDINFQ